MFSQLDSQTVCPRAKFSVDRLAFEGIGQPEKSPILTSRKRAKSPHIIAELDTLVMFVYPVMFPYYAKFTVLMLPNNNMCL